MIATLGADDGTCHDGTCACLYMCACVEGGAPKNKDTFVVDNLIAIQRSEMCMLLMRSQTVGPHEFKKHKQCIHRARRAIGVSINMQKAAVHIPGRQDCATD